MRILIDANFLCHRAHAAIGRIYEKGKRLEVPFGVLRDVSFLYARYAPESVIWCFDSRNNIRKTLYPAYKANRTQGKNRKILWKQIDRLRKTQLKSLGFRNVFVESGYEADDLIAHFINNTHFSQPIVIVSADSDMKQLLTNNVVIYNPISKTEETKKTFTDKWGIPPALWPTVKAIAGDSSDNINGVPRVGQRTAIKYLKGEMNERTATYKTITEFEPVWKKNLELIQLPLKGLETKKYKVKVDHVTMGQWREGIKRMGLQPISFPIARSK